MMDGSFNVRLLLDGSFNVRLLLDGSFNVRLLLDGSFNVRFLLNDRAVFCLPQLCFWLSDWFMGSFDDAVVRSICGSNDENLCAWWVADVVATGHMNNSNGSGSGLAARDPSFWCRASSLTAMVGIVHDRSIVAAV
jgi:hypothetical protein